MKKMLRLKSLSLLLVALFLITGSVLGQQYRNGLKQGAVRVKFKPQISATLNSVQATSVNGVLHTGIQAFDKVNTQLNAVSMKRVFPYSPKHEAKHKQYGLDLWYEVTYTSGLEAKEAVAGYASLNEVNKAEAIRQKTFVKGQMEYASASTKSGGPFNDPYLDQQWHYNNDGTLGTSVVGGDINLYEGWEIETGKPNVIVSIVDGGVDTDHEDLAANMWINEAEKNGEEGVDDDGNGYIDDINGYNFVTNNATLTDHYHGTHVAGTVAAVSNNNIGVAGVAGGSGNNDGIRLMSSQIFSEEVSGAADTPAAIVYGADNGAVISQNSWGYPSPGYIEQVILDAIDYFIAEAGNYAGSPMKGGVVFFAAGNENKEGEFYPGCYESAISVSALAPNLKKAGYSNYGTWVNIAAPGGDQDFGREHGILSTLPDNKYGYLNGTSMACPHVTGVAALVVSKFGGSTFTNEDLKVHVLTGTHDIDIYNPDYAGKLGVGYLDTRWALQTNNEIAPNPVADLNLIGIAQDFAKISWSVPADEDDLKPVSFEVLYSTNEITNENADLADKIDLAMTPADTVGTAKEYEIQELKPTTDYYFAIRSIDRWGNVSEISNVATGRTNAGPGINTDKQEINFTIDASVATSVNDVFAILNEDVGVLKWEGFTRHKKPSLSYNTASINYPKPSASPGSSKTLGFGDVEPLSRSKDMQISAMDDTEPTADFYDEFCYSSNASNIVGEEDINITNSIATRYFVEQEAGFNLTFIESFLQHTPATGPMVVEVYQGDKIHENNLILAEEITSYNTTAYWHALTLDEQLFFEQGETFWIVIHVPSGNLYPLGMGWENSPENSDNCFYSNDMGAIWTPMAEAIGDDRFVWNVAAVSKNQHLGNYITLNPSSGVVEGNSSQEVELTLDASKLINGTYRANVVLESNDGDDRFFRVPVNLTLSGQLPKLVNASVVDFGGVFFGHDKEMTIAIANAGYGNFNVQSVVSTDDQFEIIQKPRSIKAQTTEELTILYTPDGAGNDNGSIEFTDKMGRTHSINLFGVAAAPSEITVAPAEQQLPDMGIGETASTSVTISNTGDYPLEYVIPAFAPDVEIEGMDAIHKFGYTLESNVNGNTSADFVWDDLSNNAVDVTTQLARTEYAYRYLEVDLGFEFPFYGEKINKINLTRLGALTLSQEGNLFNCSPSVMTSRCSPAGFISAFAMKFDLSLSGSVKYKREPGKFIIEYSNVVRSYEWNMDANATFQIVLFYNGDVEMRYKDIENFSAHNLKSALVALSDPSWEDGFQVHGYEGNWTYKDGGLKNNETIYRFKSPGESLITEVSEPHGILKVGESKTIDVKLSTEGMNESSLYQRLSIACNDPFNNPAAFTVKVNVTSGGVSDVKLNKTEVNLGSVFQGGESHDLLVVTNDGNKDVELTAINWTNDKFILKGDVPVLLKPKSTYYIPVEINTSEIGVFDDVLVIETNEGGRFEAQLHADVISAPAISLDISSITETLDAGQMVSKTITVTNNGESDLEIVPAGNDWLYLSQPEAMSAELPEFSYYYQTSDDVDGPAYSWNDIRKEGVHFHSENWVEDGEPVLWQAVALPYELTYYNQTTDSIWVSWQGMISMSTPKDESIMYWPDPIPTPGKPNNVICPYFAQQNTDVAGFGEEAGVFYKIYDDRVVIMWSEQYDGFGMGDNYNFQAILYKNGNIKFQYKTGQWSMTSYGVVGLENADGTEGVQLAYMQNFIKDGLAVSFTPAEKELVPAGQSKQYTLAVDAGLLNKGNYEGNFRFFNNTPTNGEVKVAVNLTVNGDAAIEASTDAFEFGEKMAYTIIGDFGPEPMSYYQDFTVENSGKDVLNFTSIAMMDGSDAVAEIYYIDPWWGWGSWVPVSTSNLSTLKPGESAKLRMRLFPSGNASEVNDTLVFSSNLPDGDFKLPVHATIFLPPVVGVDQDTISAVANTLEDVLTRSFVIDNIEGQSVLDYHIGISYNRKGEEANAAVASLANTIDTPLVSELIAQTETTGNLQLFADETYHATLEHDTLSSPSNALGFGESLPFITSTAFQAPADGFNLTHVKTWYFYQDVLESRITVEIRGGGTSVADAKVLSRESFDVVVDNPQEFGEYFTFELSENQIFFPGETFYVVFEYDLGVAVPQAMANGLENVDGRFMYSNGEEWGDIQRSGYSGEGWMVKAMEKEHKSKSWAVIDGAVDGTVPVGESVTVNINFLPVDAVDAENDALMTIATNDPMNPESFVNLNLRINQGPQFELETGLSVKENENLNFDVISVDLEEDDCTYSLAEAYDFVQMTEQNDTLSFVYTPDYESAGLNTFILTGTDSYGNVTNLEIPIEVVNVNRAPEVINTIATREYYEDGEYDEINLTSVFEDPDGEALTYSVSSDNESFINIFVADEDVIIKSQAEGNGLVTLVATDTEGLSVETSFEVIVGTVTGIEDVEGTSETKVYPVPTSGPLNIVLGNDIEGEVSISILNVTGLTQYQTTVNKMSGEHIERLNISNMPSGIYLVKITSAKGDTVKRVVKM